MIELTARGSKISISKNHIIAVYTEDGQTYVEMVNGTFEVEETYAEVLEVFHG